MEKVVNKLSETQPNHTTEEKVNITGAEAVLKCLIAESVNTIFGYPGGAIMPVYDALYHYTDRINHILPRHEQGAIHAAEGYARVTRKTGVAMATSGPGAMNLMTGLADAMLDSTPLVCITGQVASTLLGSDAFQETDVINCTMPVTKWNHQITHASEIPSVFAKAFYIANSGRPGPVVIDITKDAQNEFFDFEYSPCTNIRSYHPLPKLNEDEINSAAQMINEAKKPLILAGHGIQIANAQNQFKRFVEKSGIPVACTLHGLSSLPDDHPQHVGMLGMHGNYGANIKQNECDVLIAIGMRFDDRVTGKLEEFASNAEVLHVDIDPAEVSKNRCPQLAIIGDVRKVLIEVLKKVRKNLNVDLNQTKSWLKRIYKWKDSYPLMLTSYKNKTLSPQETISYVGKENKNAFFTTDVGQHQMWSAQLINCEPKKWISSSGLGTMGFGLPAAIGAKVANPKQNVICISGDSSFQMNIQELGTISHYNLGITTIIINNGWQGMVRQWQESFYGNRFSNSYMRNGMPNFAEVAKAYGLYGFRVNDLNELSEKFHWIKEMNSSNLFFSMIVDVNVIEKENCYPMVAPGRSNAQMLGLEEQKIFDKK